MGRGFLRARQESIDEPTVNLTPLIDVVFVILIGFIIIAPLLEMDKVELAEASSAPLAVSASVQQMGPIAIHVHQDNSIWIKKRAVQMPELAAFLKDAKTRYPEATPQLFHDKRGQFGTYQNVKNALEAAGFEHMDVILKP
jgi:biopolymer transport protein ExbD